MPIRFDQNFGMYVVTDAAGNRLGTARTPEEARALEASGVGKTTAPTNQEFGRVSGNNQAATGSISGGQMGYQGTRRDMIGTEAMQAEDAALVQSRLDRDARARAAAVPYGTPIAMGGTANVITGSPSGSPSGMTSTFIAPDAGGGLVNKPAGTVTGNEYGVTNAAAGNLAATDRDARARVVAASQEGTDPNAAAFGGGQVAGGAGGAGGPNDLSNSIDGALGETIEYIQGPPGANDTQGIIDKIDEVMAGGALKRNLEGKGQIDQAINTQQEIVDRVLSQESDARIIAEQMAAEQRGQALSARGGAAAQQQAMTQAAANAPALQQAAFRTANQETTQRNALAGQIAGKMGDTAIGSEQNDIRIQEGNATLADGFAGMIERLGGVELKLNQEDRHKIGQMMYDFNELFQDKSLGWAQLSVTERLGLLDNMFKYYQVDETIAAQIKMTAMNNETTFMEDFTKLIGAAAPVGASAVGAPGAA